MNAGNFLSPEGLIMLSLAVVLDAIGIILVCFALDDFFITDIVGWLTLGVWSSFRSQIRGSGGAIEMPNIEERRKEAQKLKQAKTAKTAKTAKAGKWARWIRFLEFVPYLGVVPFWTISTFLILKEE